MKKNLKILSVLLSLALILGCISFPISAAVIDEKCIFNTNDRSEIQKKGLTVNSKITVDGHNYSAKWTPSENLIFSDVTDISSYDRIEFYMYGDPNYAEEMIIIVNSQNPSTDGTDYYSCPKFTILDGWNKYSFDFESFSVSRTPRGWNDIDNITFFVEDGWGIDYETNAKATVYLDSINLIKTDRYLEDGSINIESDFVPAFKQVASDAVEEVKTATCMKVGSPYALVKHNRQALDVAPAEVNGNIFVPKSLVVNTYGAVSGCDVQLINGVEMVNAAQAAAGLGKSLYTDEMGIVIISDSDLGLSIENNLGKLLDIASGFIYERPEIEKIKEDILATAPEHPRILATAADFERIKALRETDSNIKTWTDNLISTSDTYASQIPTEGEHPYYADAGGRLGSSYSVRKKSIYMGMAYQLTGDKKYPEALWTLLEDLCAWEHWHPGHFLNAADMMWGIAIAYDWMYEAWSSDQKKILEEALFDCGIEDSLTAYYGAKDYISPPMSQWHRSGWWSQGNNWNAVCNSGVLAAGLSLATHEEYGALAVKAVNFATRAIEIGLRCYAPDGGYEEGPGYWSYATNEAVLMMSALRTAAGTTYGLSDAPGFSSTYATGLYSESKKGMFNFSDTDEGRTNTTSLMWFGKEYGLSHVAGVRLNEVLGGEKSYSYTDILWYDPENIDRTDTMEYDYSFFATDTFTMRSSWNDKEQIFTGLHGGSNTANHCNIDSGTFVLDALGQRWFFDYGSDNYNLPNYWGTGTGGKRWYYYTQRAEGHNTIVINPRSEEDQVIQSVSPLIEFVSKTRGAYGKVDLTPAYANDVEKAIRGNMLTNDRRTVIIQDEITMKAPSEFYWFAHTKATVELAEDGRSALLTLGGKQLRVTIVSENSDLVFEVMDPECLPTTPIPEASDTQKENSREGSRKLAIHAIDVEEVKLAVVMQPIVEGQEEYKYTYTNLDDWEIEDGKSITVKPKNIYADSSFVQNFDPYNTECEIILPKGTKHVPELYATFEDQFKDAYEYEVLSLPESIPGTGIIRIKDKTSSEYTDYSVYMREGKEIEPLASDAQEGNGIENCLDKDFNTRWEVETVNGEAHWGIFTFDKPKTVSSVWLATWKSSERKLIFDIEVSYDGKNFTKVWSGQTTSDTDTLEEFKIPLGTYKAIKLVLHGTTTVGWNSILELDFTNNVTEGNVIVNVNVENGESVGVDGVEIGSHYTGQLAVGSKIVLTANSTNKFIGWIDSDTGAFLSTSSSYTHTAYTNKNITAVYGPASSKIIQFTSLSDRLLNYGKSGAVVTPSDPYMYGYSFEGWYRDGTLQSYKENDVVSIAENVNMMAGYLRNTTRYTVNVNGKKQYLLYNTLVEVTADKTKDGKAFSYWQRDGKIVSYDLSYSFYTDKDTVLESVYGKTTENKALLVMGEPIATEDNRIAFFAERNIPSEYTVVQTGILLGKSDDLTLETAIAKVVAKKTTNVGQCTARWANVKKEYTYYARAYAMYYDTEGNLKTAYSNVVSDDIAFGPTDGIEDLGDNLD